MTEAATHHKQMENFMCSELFMLRIKSHLALIPLLLLSKSQPLRWVVIWYRRFAAFFDFIEISVLTVLCRNPLKRNGFKGFLF